MKYWRQVECIATAIAAVSWPSYFVESARLAVDSPKAMAPNSGHIYFFQNHTLTGYITLGEVWELRILLWSGMLSVVIALWASARWRK